MDRLRNDDERRAYIEDAGNWVTIYETDVIRIEKLEYKNLEWHRFSFWKRIGEYDYQRHKFGFAPGWADLLKLEFDADARVYRDSASTTKMMMQMKECDREG